MQTRRKFLHTLAAAPAVIAVPPLLAMGPPDPDPIPEVEPWDSAEYSCGILWIEADFSCYIHSAVYRWQQWDIVRKRLETKRFEIINTSLAGQCELIVQDPKIAIPFTARNGRGTLDVLYNDGIKAQLSPFHKTGHWEFNDMNNTHDNAYWRRIVVA